MHIFRKNIIMPYNYPQNQPPQPQNQAPNGSAGTSMRNLTEDLQNASNAGQTSINQAEYMALSLSPEDWLQQNPGKDISLYYSLQRSGQKKNRKIPINYNFNWLKKLLPPGLELPSRR